jgi:hypothetical protein
VLLKKTESAAMGYIKYCVVVSTNDASQLPHRHHVGHFRVDGQSFTSGSAAEMRLCAFLKHQAGVFET